MAGSRQARLARMLSRPHRVPYSRRLRRPACWPVWTKLSPRPFSPDVAWCAQRRLSDMDGEGQFWRHPCACTLCCLDMPVSALFSRHEQARSRASSGPLGLRGKRLLERP